MPVLSTALAIAGIAASGVGIGESVSASNKAAQGAQTNNQIAAQELANKQQVFQQLSPFYSQYLQQGSPYLQNIQRAGAEQNAQQFGNAAGQLRQQMNTSGLGFGPSGTTAAALGQLGQGMASSSANNYLQNLLNNEQVKFQAAQGLNSVGNMFNGQNTVGQPPAPVQSTVGSSVNAFGQSLQNLVPQPAANPPFGTPTAQAPAGVGITTGPTLQQAGITPPATQGDYFGSSW